MLAMTSYPEGAWRPLVIKTEALHHQGIPELLNQIDQHRAHLGAGFWQERQRQRIRGKFMEILRDSLFQEAVERLQRDERWEALMEDLGQRRIDPYSAMEKVMGDLLKPVKGVE
jgi:LAO/AO transport system kinase